MTSHDVVGLARRWFQTRRIGHAGTLDPGAAGVLVLLVGQATRLAVYVQQAEKSYRAEMTLGVETDTQDASGRTVRVAEPFSIPWGDVDAALSRRVGTMEQRPPMVSAVHYQGRRLYELARDGVEVERPARRVEIYDVQILRVWPQDAEHASLGSRVLFDVTCSAGTYVRTLCADVGAELGCGAHLSFLVRTRAGSFALEQAVTLEDLEQAARQRRQSDYLLPADVGLAHLPALRLDGMLKRRALHGAAFEWPAGTARPGGLEEGDHVRLYGESGDFLGIGRLSGSGGRTVAPECILA